MAEFKADEFMQDPDIDLLESLNKENLFALAKHLGLAVKKSMRKSDIQNMVMNELVSKGVFSDEDLNPTTSSSIDYQLEMKKIEVEQNKLAEQAKQRELEEKRLEQEKQVEIAKLELERAKIETDKARLQQEKEVNKMKALEAQKFDPTKHIRLVPPFKEKDVDQYFLHFEKVAANLQWPKENWTMLLQSVLTGKAREIYTQLSIEQTSDYDTVKDLILKAYELVPEAYRQKFRNWDKRSDQTYVEFARTKEQLFDRWCNSKKVDKNFLNLRQLMLIEEFKRCVSSEIKTFIDEQNAETLDKAATLADDYSLTHKVSFAGKPNQSFTFKGAGNQKQQISSNEVKGQSQGYMRNERSNEQKSEYKSGSNPKGPSFGNVVCHYCKKTGHFMSDCYKLKNDKEKQPPTKNPTGYVSRPTFRFRNGYNSDNSDSQNVLGQGSKLKQGNDSSCSKQEFLNSDSNNEFASSLGHSPGSSLNEAETSCENVRVCNRGDGPGTNHDEARTSIDSKQEFESNEHSSRSDEAKTSCKSEKDLFKKYIYKGIVSLSNYLSNSVPIKILRDTGCGQSLIVANKLPFNEGSYTGKDAVFTCVFMDTHSLPLHQVYLKSKIYTGPMTVGLRPTLPFTGFHLILGNDVADTVLARPSKLRHHSNDVNLDSVLEDIPALFESCVITRSKKKKAKKNTENSKSDTKCENVENTSNLPVLEMPVGTESVKSENVCDSHVQERSFSRSELLSEQQKDPDVSGLFAKAVKLEDVAKSQECFYVKDKILMHKWQPSNLGQGDLCAEKHQIVVPKLYHNEILNRAHVNLNELSGHLSFRETYQRIVNNFYWPSIRKHVMKYCNSCQVCQMAGEPDHKVNTTQSGPKPIDRLGNKIIASCIAVKCGIG